MEKAHVMNADKADIEQLVANAIKSISMKDCQVTINIANQADASTNTDNIEQVHSGTVKK